MSTTVIESNCRHNTTSTPGEMLLRQSTPDPDSTQMYERDPETDTDSGSTEGVTKIPELAQINLESRQHQIVASQTASRLVQH